MEISTVANIDHVTLLISESVGISNQEVINCKHIIYFILKQFKGESINFERFVLQTSM